MEKTVILITGANKGIGYEMVKQLATSQHIVILAARDRTLGSRAIERLYQEKISSDFVQLDVENESSIKEAAQYINKKYGRLDVLINNAGILLDMHTKLSELSLYEFQKTMNVNLFGVFLVTNIFLPLLKKSNNGRIINMSSDLGSIEQASDINSKYYEVPAFAYRVSKAALGMLTLAYAKELKETAITVTAANPGWCKTDLGSDVAPKTASQGAETPVWLALQTEKVPFHSRFFSEKEEIAW